MAVRDVLRSVSGMHISCDSVCGCERRHIEIVPNLQIHPELWRHGEVTRESKAMSAVMTS
jgi:hypothetical protein